MSSISVVIPARNSAAFLSSCLNSVLAQQIDGVGLEVIVVDDASTDDTNEVLDDYRSRIRVLSSTQNIERAASRNWGAREATGTHLAFLDADDWWHPRKLARQLSLYPSSPSVTGYFLVNDRCRPGPRIDRGRALRRVWLENLFLGAPSSLVIHRDQFLDMGGFPEDRELQGSEDWLFLFRLCAIAQAPQVVHDRLVFRRIHSKSHSASADSVARSMSHAMMWILPDPSLSKWAGRRLRSRTAMTIACHLAREGRFREAAANWGRAIQAGGAQEVLALLPGLLKGMASRRMGAHG